MHSSSLFIIQTYELLFAPHELVWMRAPTRYASVNMVVSSAGGTFKKSWFAKSSVKVSV